jgi:hypothetical protein
VFESILPNEKKKLVLFENILKQHKSYVFWKHKSWVRKEAFLNLEANYCFDIFIGVPFIYDAFIL